MTHEVNLFLTVISKNFIGLFGIFKGKNNSSVFDELHKLENPEDCSRVEADKFYRMWRTH